MFFRKTNRSVAPRTSKTATPIATTFFGVVQVIYANPLVSRRLSVHLDPSSFRVAAGVLACRKGLASRRPDFAPLLPATFEMREARRVRVLFPPGGTPRLYGRRDAHRYYFINPDFPGVSARMQPAVRFLQEYKSMVATSVARCGFSSAVRQNRIGCVRPPVVQTPFHASLEFVPVGPPVPSQSSTSTPYKIRLVTEEPSA